MAERKERSDPHPDDFMIVTVSLEFQAKLNPKSSDPLPFDTTYCECTFEAEAAADYLEQVVRAIRERRLYGFMVQDAAESAVGAGDWVEKTTEDMIAEARARDESSMTKENPTNAVDAPDDD
jgi:hypothetical protein